MNPNNYGVLVGYQFPMGKVKLLGTMKMAQVGKRYQFPMGKVEVLSKSASDWLTVPMQQRSNSGFIRDWLRATAKDVKV